MDRAVVLFSVRWFAIEIIDIFVIFLKEIRNMCICMKVNCDAVHSRFNNHMGAETTCKLLCACLERSISEKKNSMN